LRKDVLSQATGGGFGLIILFRQGMIAWMRACAEAPPFVKLVPRIIWI
jgi:hypothetical protein